MAPGVAQFQARRRIRISCAVVLLLLCAGFLMPAAIGLAGSENRRPTSRPAETEAQLKTWFAELAHPDAKVRAEARMQLMGIRASRLPQLRHVVADSRPLSAEQVAALRPIITQIFLAS